ncbi:MAG: hypothetical protein SWY16_19955 [Cyanobacteriota bacterium]|nr:hypothetical protein [Cyanobacteriota bacterium]
MNQSRHETDLAKKGYAIVGIVLAPIVLLAFANGIMAFVRVFTHTLGAILWTLEISFVAFVVGALGFWLVQRDRQSNYARMEAVLEQFALEKKSAIALSEFAEKVELPIPTVRAFLDAAIQEKRGTCQANDCGEWVYYFIREPSPAERVKTVDVEAISTEKIDAAATTFFTSRRDAQGDRKSLSPSDRPEIKSIKSSDSQTPNPSPTRSPSLPSNSPIEDRAIATPDPSPTDLEKPLIQAQLARRLSLSSSTLSYRKLKPNFSEWVREKDPDGIAWSYSPDTKQFYPQ